jgi:hypothetical protein
MKQLKIIGFMAMIISISLFTNQIKAQQMATANKV